jgi:hypothetical protein
MLHLQAVAGLALHSHRAPGVRPLILGYLHFPHAVTDRRVAHVSREMAAYAEREGFTLAEVYVDRPHSNGAGFAALVDALAREEAAHVLVPALRHLAHTAALQRAIRVALEHRTGAQVLVMHPTPGPGT